MALWRTRTLNSDQKAQIAEEQQDGEVSMLEDAGLLLDTEDAKMSRVCVAELPINVSHFASHLLHKITQCTYEHTIVLNKVQLYVIIPHVSTSEIECREISPVEHEIRDFFVYN